MDRLPVPNLNEDVESLRGWLTDNSLLKELLRQLKKDFASAAVEAKLRITVAYSFQELCELIEEALIRSNSGAISNLLYRVDISEHQLKSEMKSPGLDYHLLAELIIKRELQKVVIRRLYSGSAK